MMADSAFPREERFGLLVAVVAHGALIAFLVLRPPAGDIVRPPERISVSLSEEVGLTSTSPDPFSDAAPDLAPTIGDSPPSEPEIADAAPIRPAPVAAPERPRPAPVVAQSPQQDVRPRRRPDRPTPPSPSHASQRTGGSRLGNNFLDGVTNSDRGASTSSPAATFGQREQASLASAITRQLRPHWSSPQGVDVELLVTTVRFQLAEDGSLIGEPRVIRQTGRTAGNANQQDRHAEQAVRAIKLAAPFNLPSQFYSQWRTITSNFDRNLSQ